MGRAWYVVRVRSEYLVEVVRVDMRHPEGSAGARDVHPQRGVGLVDDRHA